MQAHATVATLCKNTIRYPFIAFLVSGGHSLISVANGPEKFELYGQSICGSCGECLDKVTRALLRKMNIKEERHFGSVLEDMAGRLVFSQFQVCVFSAQLSYEECYNLLHCLMFKTDFFLAFKSYLPANFKLIPQGN